MAIQQNAGVTFAEFTFSENKNEQTLIIAADQIAAGVNVIHLLDQNLEKMAERIIFNPLKSVIKTEVALVSKRTDSIVIRGTSSINAGTLSISVLPAGTDSANPNKNMQGILLFDAYLKGTIQKAEYYLSDFSKKKHYELDNFLITQKSKYDWKGMIGNPPQRKFNFDKGLTIKGTINTDIKESHKYKINLNSLGLGLNEFTTLNDKNEFYFENILALDSTKIYFSVLDKEGKRIPAKIYSQVLNNNRKFIKPFASNIPCPAAYSEPGHNISFPKIRNAILLDSVTISADKNRLKHNSSNNISSGFKISEKDAMRYRDILQFIDLNGFTVSTIGGIVSISSVTGNTQLGNTSLSRGRNSISAATDVANRNLNSPAVYIDDMHITNLDILRDYTLNTVDEIYLNRHSNDLSVYGSHGIIKIYTKKNFKLSNNNISNRSEALIVKNGFSPSTPFANQKYDNVKDNGFQQFGTIHWKAATPTDENGKFGFSIPNLNQKDLKIIIEGISNEGQLSSETIILQIPD